MATITLDKTQVLPLPETRGGWRSYAARPFVTPEQYLMQERTALNKHEYVDGEVREMPGASRFHNLITGNIITVLNLALVDRESTEVYPSDIRVHIAPTNRFTYPDVVVISGEEPRFTDSAVDTLLNPTVLFEVLSDSTEAYDRGKKFANYQMVPSLKEYVLVSQDEPRIELFRRDADGGWKYESVTGTESSASLRSLDIAISLKDVYRKVTFPAPNEAAEPETDTRA